MRNHFFTNIAAYEVELEISGKTEEKPILNIVKVGVVWKKECDMRIDKWVQSVESFTPSISGSKTHTIHSSYI